MPSRQLGGEVLDIDDHVDDSRAASFPLFRPTSGELARRCAERWGDAPFVVLGDERLTYAAADARSAPRHVAVFAQAELPPLDSGKVDRRRLAQALSERFGPGEERAEAQQRRDP